MTAEQRNMLASVVSVDPTRMHGTPCFANTRVPVQTLLDFLEGGETVDAFLAVYPYIPREHVISFLELTKDLAVEQLVCESS
jgi:uncharacterized protein (DUF433 family)